MEELITDVDMVAGVMDGGEWHGNNFYYNTAVNNVNTTTIYNTYVNNTIINNTTIVNNNRASFNGQGGVTARPTRQEQIALRETHVNPTPIQLSHESSASADRSQFASVNHGHPAKLAVAAAIDNNRRITPQNNQATSQQSHNGQNADALNWNQQAQQNNYTGNVNRHINQNIQNQDQQQQANQREMKIQQINANNQRLQEQVNQQQERNPRKKKKNKIIRRNSK